jgi:hypothetical protein
MGQSLHAQPLFDNPAPQQMFQRQHFGLLGPVQEVLIEMASFTMDENMDWVPVNRQPVEMLRFDVQGYVTETETYDFMGQLEERSVFTRTGNLVTLQTVYDGSQSLLNIIEYNYSNQKLTEEIVRSAQANLIERWEFAYPTPTSMVSRHFDSTGNLLDWSEWKEEQPNKMSMYHYDAASTLLSKSIHDIDGLERESLHYDGQLVFLMRDHSTYDAIGNILEMISYDETNTEMSRTIYEYEGWDSYNNWLSQKASMSISLGEEGEAIEPGESPFFTMPMQIHYRTFKYGTSTRIPDFMLY